MRFALELGGPTVAPLFEVRLTLEPRAAERAAERASDEQVAAIEDCVRRHGTRGLTRRELLELDTELHRLIVEASGNELLGNWLRASPRSRSAAAS
jgi:DNA-binding FadR family transcriptional regulator